MDLSLRKCVNDKCKDCSYDPDEIGSGSWRNQVLHCRVRSCPQYPVRPLPTGIKYRDEQYFQELPEERT